ncbi:MAG: LysM domain-containing protein, partial [Gammaproteobacteria bacterium]|nr:LysM domain-containing protein [Gammaproteobacteria bacterium]
RSAVLGAALALGLITATSGIAQVAERVATGAAAAVGQAGNAPVLNPRHPESYVVQQGDTLWDIAAMFLRDPWYWPEIWQINPQVANPHLIFPGDILSLAYLDDGSPVIQLTRGSGGPVEAGPIERLSPRIRTEMLEEAIPTIPYETLRAFLSRPAVLDPAELDSLPYLFAHPEGLLGSAGRDVYVRGTDAPVGTVFNFVHTGDALVDPDDGSVLGYQGLYVGQGRVRRSGDPATVFMTESAREANIGDYLIAEESVTPVTFFPRAPTEQVEGRILSVLDGVSMIGQFQVVVINRGARDGIEQGHVLDIYRTGEVISDTTRNSGFFTEKVRLPDELAGTTMVFRIFDRMSYALVMEATREIRVLDTVRNPE